MLKHTQAPWTCQGGRHCRLLIVFLLLDFALLSNVCGLRYTGKCVVNAASISSQWKLHRNIFHSFLKKILKTLRCTRHWLTAAKYSFPHSQAESVKEFIQDRKGLCTMFLIASMTHSLY